MPTSSPTPVKSESVGDQTQASVHFKASKIITMYNQGREPLFCFVFKDFIWQRKRKHKQGEHQGEREGEGGSPLSREPDAGLDPRTLESQSELKADT